MKRYFMMFGAVLILLVPGTSAKAATDPCVGMGVATFDLVVPAATGALRIVKYANDQDGFHTDELLADATFELDAPDESIRTGRTDLDGELLFEGLAPGQYTAREVAPPPGYFFLAPPQTGEVRVGEVSELIFYNTPGFPGRVGGDTDAGTEERPVPEVVEPEAVEPTTAPDVGVIHEDSAEPEQDVEDAVDPVGSSDTISSVGARSLARSVQVRPAAFAPAGASSITVELGAGLDLVAMEIEPSDAALPSPQTSGTTTTWDLSALPGGDYRLTVRASSTTSGVFPISLAGNLQGLLVEGAALLTVDVDPSCEASPVPSAVPTASQTDPIVPAEGRSAVLPRTGEPVWPVAIAGAVLLAAGACALVVRRVGRRRVE